MFDDVVIPGVVDPWFTTPPFPIGRRHTLYEWCMIYTDQNPAEGDGTGYLFPSGDHNEPTIEAMDVRLRVLGAVALRGNLVSWRNEDQQAITNAVYRTLVARTVPEIEVYLHDQPGLLDYTLCVIDVAPVLDLARQRGDYGEAIGKLLAMEADAAEAAEAAQAAPSEPSEHAIIKAPTPASAPPQPTGKRKPSIHPPKLVKWMKGIKTKLDGKPIPDITRTLWRRAREAFPAHHVSRKVMVAAAETVFGKLPAGKRRP